MASGIAGSGLAFLAGYACRAQCTLPCQAKLGSAGRPFKLSVVVHSASLCALEGGPGLVQNRRPCVGISVGDRNKETEFGDWCKERGQWCFRETITVVVEPSDEIFLSASSSTKYDLLFAAVSWHSRKLGDVCFPVVDILLRLKPEDRDADGLIFATPVMPFDFVQDGRHAGRVYLSFETLTPPPSHRPSRVDSCCGRASYKDEKACVDDEDDSTVATSSMERRSGLGPEEELLTNSSRSMPSSRTGSDFVQSWPFSVAMSTFTPRGWAPA